MSEPAPPPRSGGFTLIEVLIAIVLLTIGLVALQQLSVGAIRSVAQAGRNTTAATVATTYLEDALQQVRQGVLPQSCSDRVLPGVAQVSRLVTTEPLTEDFSVRAGGTRVAVRVTVAPTHSTSAPYVASAAAFSPVNPLPNGRPCP